MWPRPLRLVAQLDEPGRLGRAPVHAEQPAELGSAISSSSRTLTWRPSRSATSVATSASAIGVSDPAGSFARSRRRHAGVDQDLRGPAPRSPPIVGAHDVQAGQARSARDRTCTRRSGRRPSATLGHRLGASAGSPVGGVVEERGGDGLEPPGATGRSPRPPAGASWPTPIGRPQPDHDLDTAVGGPTTVWATLASKPSPSRNAVSSRGPRGPWWTAGDAGDGRHRRSRSTAWRGSATRPRSIAPGSVSRPHPGGPSDRPPASGRGSRAGRTAG